MKKLNNRNIKYQIVVTLLFITQFIQAQPVFDDAVLDVPASPIDDWIFQMGIIVIAVKYYFFKKKRQVLV